MKDTLVGFVRDAHRLGPSDSDFGELALELYRWQRAHNPVYDAFCGDARVAHWTEIPTVPVALFRDLELCCFEPSDSDVIFRTSGTTGRPGVHRLRDTEVYDLGSRRHAEACIGPLPNTGISLVSHAPDSSLGHMCESFVPGMLRCMEPELGLSVERSWRALQAAREPVFLPMTGLAAATLVGKEFEPIALPVGSIVMVTGGFKGRELEIDARRLQHNLERAFPGVRLVGEYGMTELSSQLWSSTLGEAFTPPPWMRVLAVDPWTGTPASEGLLRFYDLANHQTVLAIETSDRGRVLDDGRVELMGRLPGSRTRGCSLRVEEALLAELRSAPARRPAPDQEHTAAVAAAPLPPHAHHVHEHSCEEPSREAPSPISDSDERRITRVLNALVDLRNTREPDFGDGLTRSQIRGGLAAAVAGITREGLRAELSRHPEGRPDDVTLVIARGVFTAPLEWVALYAAAGIELRLKVPEGAEEFCVAIVRAFEHHGLPVSVLRGHDLGQASAIVAFGSDETMARIERESLVDRKLLFGHRFSVGLTTEIHAQVLAWEVAHYDTRGCMAPAGFFCLTDPSEHLESLALQMRSAERAIPRGTVDPSLGPEWRRRIGLARCEGSVVEGEGWAITVLPSRYFHPVALPRMLTLYGIREAEDMYRALGPWRNQLSTLGTDDLLRPWKSRVWEEIYDWFPRRVPLGHMQRPSLPRLHDGREMLGAICR